MDNPCGHHIINDECKVCRKIQSKWYKRISSSFSDIECMRYKDRPLKSWSANILANVTMDELESIHDKYGKMYDMLRSFEFASNIHRKIWELHCEGLSRREIAKKIEFKLKQASVGNIIRNLEREMTW